VFSGTPPRNPARKSGGNPEGIHNSEFGDSMKIQKMTLIIIAVMIALNVTVHGGVKYVKTWKNPKGQSGTWKGKKVVVFAGTLLNDTRQGAEQAMVRELAKLGVQGIPAYTAIPPAAEKDLEMAKRILTDGGIAGALIMRVVGIQDETSVAMGTAYYLGPSYDSFYGFWGGGNFAYVPPEIRTKTKLQVETLVYSVDQDKLVWTGTSGPTSPDNVDKLIKQLVGATREEIKKAGLAGQ
jgi:hypothetical protein